MRTRKNTPFEQTSSSFDGYLEEEGILDEVITVASKRVVTSPLDIAAQADVMEGIRQGLEDEKNGKLQPIREFFAEFEAKYGITHD